MPRTYLDTSDSLLLLWQQMKCQADRDAVVRMMQVNFDTYNKQSDVIIRQVNQDISALKSQGVVAEAVKMRDEVHPLSPDKLRSEHRLKQSPAPAATLDQKQSS